MRRSCTLWGGLVLIDKCTDRQNPLGRLCISLCVAVGDVSTLWMMSAGRVDLPPQDKRRKASRANETHKKTGQVKKNKWWWRGTYSCRRNPKMSDAETQGESSPSSVWCYIQNFWQNHSPRFAFSKKIGFIFFLCMYYAMAWKNQKGRTIWKK